jgi:HRAS-like suppressor 3
MSSATSTYALRHGNSRCRQDLLPRSGQSWWSGRELLCDRPALRMCCSEGSSVRTDMLEAGTELIADRLGYRHHGIYVGEGLVIHYAGWIRYWRGLIETIPLGDFAGRRPVRVGRMPTESLHGEDIVRRARSRLGERCYDVLRNNCEHFCNWCQVGESRSAQIDVLLRPMQRVMRIVRRLLPRLGGRGPGRPLRLTTCLKPAAGHEGARA